MCVCAPTSAPRAIRINTLPRTLAYAPQTRHAHSQTSTHNADVAQTLRGHKITAGLLPLDCRLLPFKATALKV